MGFWSKKLKFSKFVNSFGLWVFFPGRSQLDLLIQLLILSRSALDLEKLQRTGRHLKNFFGRFFEISDFRFFFEFWHWQGYRSFTTLKKTELEMTLKLGALINWIPKSPLQIFFIFSKIKLCWNLRFWSWIWEALRVPPAETRLTVYRRRPVLKICQFVWPLSIFLW